MGGIHLLTINSNVGGPSKPDEVTCHMFHHAGQTAGVTKSLHVTRYMPPSVSMSSEWKVTSGGTFNARIPTLGPSWLHSLAEVEALIRGMGKCDGLVLSNNNHAVFDGTFIFEFIVPDEALGGMLVRLHKDGFYSKLYFSNSTCWSLLHCKAIGRILHSADVPAFLVCSAGDRDKMDQRYFENFSRSLLRGDDAPHISVFGKVYFGALSRMQPENLLREHVDVMKLLHEFGVNGVFPSCLWTGPDAPHSLDASNCPWRVGEFFANVLHVAELNAWASTYIDKKKGARLAPNPDDIAREWDWQKAIEEEMSESRDAGSSAGSGASAKVAARPLWTSAKQQAFVGAVLERFGRSMPDDSQVHHECGRQQKRFMEMDSTLRSTWTAVLVQFTSRLVPRVSMPDFSPLLLSLEESGTNASDVEEYVRDWQPP